MTHLSHRRRASLGGAAAVGCALTALVAGLVAVPADAAPERRERSSLAELRVVPSEDGAGPLAVEAPQGRPLAPPAGVSASDSDVTVARAHLQAIAPLWGVAAGPDSLQAVRSSDVLGDPVVRFAQKIDGVPVYGAELVVSLEQDGSLTSVAGSTVPDTHLTYSVSADRARAVALDAAEDALKLPARVLTSHEPRRFAYDPSLIGDAGDGVVATWRVVVTGPRGSAAKAEVFVDAVTAKVVKVIGGAEALNRAICDAGPEGSGPTASYNSDEAYGWCGQNTGASTVRYKDTNGDGRLTIADTPHTLAVDPVRNEGDPATGIADVDQAYVDLGYTSTFYQSIGVDLTALIGMTDAQVGRSNSVDLNTRRLSGVVRYCEPPEAYYPMTELVSMFCPYDNAYWVDNDPDWTTTDATPFPGGQMFIGQGLARSSDVIGHELTHGVTAATNGLIYANQSGAINESMSDVFGQLTQEYAAPGGDPAWLIGEDLAGPTISGAIRSMSNPATQSLDEGYPQPDTMTSGWWDTDPWESDNGGVHTNSGVGNKAAYLIARGGTFNGVTVNRLDQSTGVDSQAATVKVARLYWKAQQTLPANANYRVLANRLDAACRSLVGSFGFTLADCTGSVDRAIAATKMTSSKAAISLSKTKVKAGKSLKITGRIGDARNGGVPNVAITLQRKSPGASSWTSIGSGVTSSASSTYAKKSWTVRPTRTSYYRVVYSGGGIWKGSASVTRLVTLVPTISKTVNKTSIGYRKSFTVKGAVSPKLAGKKVYLQKYSSGRWRTVDKDKLSARSKYEIRYRPTSRADLKYRVYLPATNAHGKAYSSKFRITVR